MNENINANEMTSETLTGDITAWLCDRLKHHKKSWEEMNESEQSDVISSASSVAKNMVREAVGIIASDGRQVIECEVEKVEFKDGVKATLKASKSSEYRHELADSQGQIVLLVVADAERYEGGDLPEADKDEPALFDKTAQGQDLGEESQFPE